MGVKERERRKGKKKKPGAPSVRWEQEAASTAGTLTEGDLEATWELREKKKNSASVRF